VRPSASQLGFDAQRRNRPQNDLKRTTMSWTDERIDALRKMWEAGQTASQIAEELGGVSRNAVIGKAHRLGLQSRPSPVKPGAVVPAKRGSMPFGSIRTIAA
jgi:GcrA cell cycle regulator